MVESRLGACGDVQWLARAKTLPGLERAGLIARSDLQLASIDADQALLGDGVGGAEVVAA